MYPVRSLRATGSRPTASSSGSASRAWAGAVVVSGTRARVSAAVPRRSFVLAEVVLRRTPQPSRARRGRTGVPPLRPRPQAAPPGSDRNPRREAANARERARHEAREREYKKQLRRAPEQKAAEHEARRPACASCGTKFTDDCWKAAAAYPKPGPQWYPALCDPCEEQAVAAGAAGRQRAPGAGRGARAEGRRLVLAPAHLTWASPPPTARANPRRPGQARAVGLKDGTLAIVRARVRIPRVLSGQSAASSWSAATSAASADSDQLSEPDERGV